MKTQNGKPLIARRTITTQTLGFRVCANKVGRPQSSSLFEASRRLPTGRYSDCKSAAVPVEVDGVAFATDATASTKWSPEGIGATPANCMTGDEFPIQSLTVSVGADVAPHYDIYTLTYIQTNTLTQLDLCRESILEVVPGYLLRRVADRERLQIVGASDRQTDGPR